MLALSWFPSEVGLKQGVRTGSHHFKAVGLLGHIPVYLNNPAKTVDAAGILIMGLGILAAIAGGLGLSWAHRKDNKRWVRNLTITAIFAVSAGVLILCRSQLS